MDKLIGRTFNVDVTDEDINLGKSANSTECAVALAVDREIGGKHFKFGYHGASVGPTNISFSNLTNKHELSFSFDVTEEFTIWIKDFDSPESTVEPMTIVFKINDYYDCETRKIPYKSYKGNVVIK